MSMGGAGGTGGRDLGAQRWGSEQEQIDHLAQQEHQIHEAERIHAEEAAETGQPEPKKRPWWKFWGEGPAHGWPKARLRPHIGCRCSRGSSRSILRS